MARQRRRIAHLALQCNQRQPHGAAGGIAGRPAFARAGVGRMPVSAQAPPSIQAVRQGVDNLLAAAAEHPRGHRGRSDFHQQHMIEADAVEAVLQREHALDFVGLDHGGQHVAHASSADLPPRQVLAR